MKCSLMVLSTQDLYSLASYAVTIFLKQSWNFPDFAQVLNSVRKNT